MTTFVDKLLTNKSKVQPPLCVEKRPLSNRAKKNLEKRDRDRAKTVNQQRKDLAKVT